MPDALHMQMLWAARPVIPYTDPNTETAMIPRHVLQGRMGKAEPLQQLQQIFVWPRFLLLWTGER